MASKQSGSKSNLKFVVEFLKNGPWESSIHQRSINCYRYEFCQL